VTAGTGFLLDLFCCAGGATRGYQRAGFRVVGIDKIKRLRYCGDDFVHADVVDFLREEATSIVETYDLIHWSPPCQANHALLHGTHTRNRKAANHHVDYIPLVRPIIESLGLPNVLEQPVGKAPMRRDLMLCMDMFRDEIGPPPWVQRHRWFEINGFPVPQQPPHDGRHGGLYVRGWRHGINRQGPTAPYVQAYGHGGGKAEVPDMQHAMAIDWTNSREELVEAIPPAYTAFIGRAFLAGAR
jgi:hypothetical protein